MKKTKQKPKVGVAIVSTPMSIGHCMLTTRVYTTANRISADWAKGEA